MGTEAHSFKCPNCSADLKFFPDKQKFCCEYCRSEFTESEIRRRSIEVQELEARYRNEDAHAPQESVPPEEQNQRDAFSENTRLYACPSCGAEIVSDANTAASFCYYCHNPVILKGRVSGDFRPSKVVPFQINHDSAIEIFNQWAKKKWFIPKDLISNKQIEKMTGLYVPFWVADADTESHFDCLGERRESWTSGGYEYTKHMKFRVERDFAIKYSGVPADGSKKIDDRIMEAVEPFDYHQAKDFNMLYLSGFFADKYDVDKEQLYGRIRERMFKNSHRIIMDSCHYHSYSHQKNLDRVNHISWQYMMMPVWFMAFHYKDKIWEYAINGQTGKISGELPIDKKKVFITNIIVSIGVTLLTMMIGYLLGGLF